MEFLLPKPVQVASTAAPYRTHIQAGAHSLYADEPIADGGGDTGASPYQLLLASLGSCTVITLQMYAQRKGWNIGVQASLNLIREADTTTIYREISLSGELDATQRERLLQVAKACPVAKILSGSVVIQSSLVS